MAGSRADAGVPTTTEFRVRRSGALVDALIARAVQQTAPVSLLYGACRVRREVFWRLGMLAWVLQYLLLLFDLYMRKTIIQLGFFFLFAGMIWGLGENPHNNDAAIKYLVFASQLLYGNLCYDVLKSLRAVPANDDFWRVATIIAVEVFVLFSISIGLLVLAFRVPFFSYVGLIGAVIAFVLIVYRVLPRLRPEYVRALGAGGNAKA